MSWREETRQRVTDAEKNPLQAALRGGGSVVSWREFDNGIGGEGVERSG